FVIVPLVQLSVKVASNSVPTTVYSHKPASVSRVAFGTDRKIGSSLSSTVITVEQVAVCPLRSATGQTIVVSPFGRISPARVAVPLKSLVILPSAQFSVKVASNSVPTTVYSHKPASVSRVAFGTQVIIGSSLSSTVITVEQVAVCPLPSSTVQTIVVSPFGSISPAIEAVPFKSFVIVPLVQLSVKVASNSVPTTVY